MDVQYRQRIRSESLATLIHDAVCREISIYPLEQSEFVCYCRSYEEIPAVFNDALSYYPHSVLQMPMTVVSMHLANLDDFRKTYSIRKLKRVIKLIAPGIRHCLSDADVIVRYGRAKFAMLLIGANEKLATKICQRIKETLLVYSYFKLGLKNQLYWSFVISEHNPRYGNDLGELIIRNERSIRDAEFLTHGIIQNSGEFNCESYTDSFYHLMEPCEPLYVVQD